MDIKHELSINAGLGQIFNAITTQEGIEGWWSSNCKIDCELGRESLVTFVKEGKVVEMHFLTKEVEENKKLVWLCTDNGNPVWIGTVLTFEIMAGKEGSVLIFTHSNFDEKHRDNPGFQMTVEGWKHFMNSLKSYCETGKGQAWG